LAKATTTKSSTKKEITAFEEELIKAVKKVREFKLAAEANIVSIFYSNLELIYTYDNLKLEDFSENAWKVYYTIAHDIVIKENKKSLDDITIGLYLEKHLKLQEKYISYGGYETILKAKEYVKEENMDGYISELKKWNIVLQLLKMKFPVYDELSRFADMTADQIYDEWEAKINHVFVSVDGNVKSYNLCEGLHTLLNKLNEGLNVGMPLYNSPILNKEIGGNLEGHVTMMGALSGMGKTTTTIEWILPQIIKYNEKLCIIINEEDKEKWQKELLVWVANNIFNANIQKHILRDGKFSDENFELLKKCADWIEEKKDGKILTIIPLPKYRTSLAIKIIKKYASMGCKKFILDTFKVSTDTQTEQIWSEMTKDSVEIYDAIKPTGKNVHIWITYQLGKGSTKQRYYSNDNIGLAKNIVDVASTNIMIRKPFDDEYLGGKNELKCYRLEGKRGLTKIPFTLDRDKHYSIIFITKNRFGATNEFQIIAENDLSRNIYKEIGITNVPMDW
jgi:replicative DNA helicase